MKLKNKKGVRPALRLLLAAMTIGLGSAAAPPVLADPCTSDCLAPGDYNLSLVSGGLPRLYNVHVPASYSGTEPVALLLDLHGGATLAAVQRSISGQLAQSDARGFIAVWPQGLDGSWNFCGSPILTQAR